MFYTGWSASTGEADWALSPLFASQNWPPTLFNTAFYSNPQVDKDLADALKTTKPEKRGSIKMRRISSGKSRRGCRWWWRNWFPPTTRA
jgi:ABC-type oligopeptide transport system substrate-binding subunit